MKKETHQPTAALARVSYKESQQPAPRPCLPSLSFQMSAQISLNALEGNSSRLTFLWEEVKAFSKEEEEEAPRESGRWSDANPGDVGPVRSSTMK